MRNKTKGFSALLLTSLVFGSFGVWVRVLSQVLTSYQQIVFRNFFALLFTVLILFLRKTDPKVIKTINKKSLLAFTLFVPLSVIFYVFAVTSEKISVVTFSFYGGTIITSWLLGTLLLREKINVFGVFSLLLVFAGLGIMNFPLGLGTFSTGFLLALLSGCLDGVANYLRKSLGGAIDKFVLVLFTAIGGVLVSGSMIAVSKSPVLFFGNLPLEIWLTGAVFGFLLVVVNFLLLFGFQNFNVSIGSVVLSAELFFATLFGFFIYGEVPGFNQMVGGFLVFAAATLPSLGEVYLKKK